MGWNGEKKNIQLASAPKIISFFGCTNIIFAICKGTGTSCTKKAL